MLAIVIISKKKKKMKFKRKAIKLRIDFQWGTLLERIHVDNASRKFPPIGTFAELQGNHFLTLIFLEKY